MILYPLYVCKYAYLTLLAMYHFYNISQNIYLYVQYACMYICEVFCIYLCNLVSSCSYTHIYIYVSVCVDTMYICICEYEEHV